MDVMTLSYVNLLIGLAGVILLSLIYKNAQSERHLLFWLSASFALCVTSICGVVIRSGVEAPYWLVPAGANLATISFSAFILSAIYVVTKRRVKYHWLFGVLALAYALNHTDFAQVSTVNRILVNFPLIIVLNLLAIKQLLAQTKSELSGVYRALIFAFVVNIIQLGTRFTLLILLQFDLVSPSQTTLIHSLGYYGLTTYAFLTLGSCLCLVYKKSSIEMRDNMERDPLTGVFNRHNLPLKLQNELQRASRSKQHVSIVMIDIDHFKKVNDSLGHVAGDLALCHVAEVVQKQLRTYDAMFRYGGEEFLICLPDTPLSSALNIANRIRKHIEQSELSALPELKLTISVGVATSSTDVSDWQLLVQHADQALYQAKRQGRNQVLHYDGAAIISL
ncbi:GGDEF domain-containing protein [Rheinheimera muenzenbergensis]|uniref:diguanylate cyclase n=1 Tax=Rheinheimera muenzenbergensis TaxID=1193628 RepID=A0ABU8CC62_9GAMM